MQNKTAPPIQTDEEMKNAGNRFFSAKKFEEAIQCYSKAIVSDLFYKSVDLKLEFCIGN